MLNCSRLVVVMAAVLAAVPVGFAQETGAAPAAAAVPADQQPTDAQLDRLFEAMRIRQQMAATAKMMPQLMQQQFAQQAQQMEKDHPELKNMTPAQREAAGKVMSKFMDQAMTLYTADEIIADMKGIYKKHLTGNDVENTITFYTSTSGQHVLDMVPVMMEEFMPAAMQKMQAKMRPLIVEMSKEMAEIMQAGGKAEQK